MVQTDLLPTQLETFQPIEREEDLTLPVSDDWLSLETIVPSMSELGTGSNSSTVSSSGEEDTPRRQTGGSRDVKVSDAAILAAGDGDDPLADSSDDNEPDESPQPTRRASETAVRLPATDDTESMVLLTPFALSSPSLEFPIEMGVDLRQADPASANSAATWMIVEKKDNERLANILVTQDRSEFHWTSAAKRSSMANLMCHGSLRDSSGQLIFLRPKIVSDPYAISFDCARHAAPVGICYHRCHHASRECRSILICPKPPSRAAASSLVGSNRWIRRRRVAPADLRCSNRRTEKPLRSAFDSICNARGNCPPVFASSAGSIRPCLGN